MRFRLSALMFRSIAVVMLVAASSGRAGAEDGWFAFNPPPDRFTGGATDLRFLNERFAGADGFIAVRNGRFVHSADGRPERFWAVNVPLEEFPRPQELDHCARRLAALGVNLVRIHGGYFREDGSVDADRIRHAAAIVAAMKKQGIYCHFSIYFPLWLKPKPGTPWLDGYDGRNVPFAALYFNPKFQQVYESWWTALLTMPDPKSGARLIDEPAVFGAEIINEDSCFFWTFRPEAIPDPQLRLMETAFGSWLKRKYGSLDGVHRRWNWQILPRDNPAAGRMAFRPLWNIAHDRTPRDRDTAAFLAENQRDFYRRTYDFLRKLGFKGLITASNWTTADPARLGPLERYSYTVGDFLDRHGYFDCDDTGPDSGWAIKVGQTWRDRSALRFDSPKSSDAKEFLNPVMDIHYNDLPSMISETTFNRPNRFRSEAPLYYACYGALQDSDSIIHFALDGSDWSVKPRFFMQPWTVMSPAMAGQFPAAALIYRRGLVASGERVASLNLGISDIENLQGTPMPLNAAFDALRAADVPRGTRLEPGQVVDPLVHYVGRTDVRFTATGGPPRLADLRKFIDRDRKTVLSSNGQLRLDYGRGVLTINAPAAQGASGNLAAAGQTELKDLSIDSGMSLGHIIAVSLDGRPLAVSNRILLQVMSEERTTGWKSEAAAGGAQRILDIGHDPWQVRNLSGTVRFRRADAARLKVTPLDFNGHPAGRSQTADRVTLEPRTMYYLVGGP